MDRFKKELSLMVMGLSLLLLYGCTVRTYTVERPRVDTEITGNRGYISGKPKPAPEKEESKLSSTRKITVVEVELRGKRGAEAPEEEAEVQEQAVRKEPAGLFREAAPEHEAILEEPESLFYKGRQDLFEEEPVAKEARPALATQDKPRYKIYTVQRNDTLQKISYKFYNTTRRWNKIFEANKDILKGPDKIYPGQVLKIPVE